MLDRATLSQIEAETYPTRPLQPEDMKTGDFDGDVLGMVLLKQNCESQDSSTHSPLGEKQNKSKLQEMSEKYAEELKDPFNPFHYKLKQLGCTEKEIEKFIEGAKLGFEVGFIKLARQLWGIDWEFQYEQFLKRIKEAEYAQDNGI